MLNAYYGEIYYTERYADVNKTADSLEKRENKLSSFLFLAFDRLGLLTSEAIYICCCVLTLYSMLCSNKITEGSFQLNENKLERRSFGPLNSNRYRLAQRSI